jgi:hypothetical protein
MLSSRLAFAIVSDTPHDPIVRRWSGQQLALYRQVGKAQRATF